MIIIKAKSFNYYRVLLLLLSIIKALVLTIPTLSQSSHKSITSCCLWFVVF